MKIESLIANNYKLLTHDNIVNELKSSVYLYNEHLDSVHRYVASINSLIYDINQMYKHVYKICSTKLDGISTLNYIGQIIIVIMRQLETLKMTWKAYGLRLQSFLDNLKKTISLFVMRVY